MHLKVSKKSKPNICMSRNWKMALLEVFRLIIKATVKYLELNELSKPRGKICGTQIKWHLGESAQPSIHLLEATEGWK